MFFPRAYDKYEPRMRKGLPYIPSLEFLGLYSYSNRGTAYLNKQQQ